MTVRYRRASGLAALLLALGGVLVGAAPAVAGDTALSLNPDTVQAGYVVGLTADCADNSKPATVESDAFGTVSLKQQGDDLTGAALVPETTAAGNYPVKLNCAGTEFAMKELAVVSAVQPTRGPATGFGGTAGRGGGGTLLLIGGIATIVA
ncbi:MAG TPA: hypothetical protein VF462_12345, partial [Micromonosporaceae bacterium]